jgi:tetratricopeptide (TPR) repeat protein
MPSRPERFNSQGNFIGDPCLKPYRFLLLSLLLAIPAFGQQDQSPELTSLLAAAQQAQAGNDYAAAAADYKQAVKLRRDVPELWANLGLMEHQTGDYGEAIQSFREANRLNPSLYVPNLFLGIDYLRSGKEKDAIPFLLKAEKMNEADPLPSLTLGRAYSSLGEFRPAIDELRRTIRLDPGQSSAWFALGIAYLRQVEEDSRALTSEDATSSYAKALFAESLVKQARYKEAAGLYKSVLDAKDQPPCMRSEAGFLDVAQGDAQSAASAFKAEREAHPECTLAILGQARLQLDANSNEDALQLLQDAWTRDREFFNASLPLLMEGMPKAESDSFLAFLTAKKASGEMSEDLYKTFAQAMSSSPSGTEEYVRVPDAARLPPPQSGASTTSNSARKDYLAGRYGLCASYSRIALTSGNADALQTLAACAFFSGNDEVSSDAGHALRGLPSHQQAAGLYWSIKANERLALASLARFQQLEPNSSRSHLLLGDIYRQREQFDDAQKEYAKALDLSPNDPAALLGLASAYFDDAKVDQSIATSQKALALNPNDPETNLVMGEALMTQHKFSDAEPFLLKSLHAKPQMLPHVHALLGEAYAANGNTQEAISQLNMGLESDQDGSVHYQLARLYAKTGNKEAQAKAIEQMKLLQQRRREGAVIALQDSHLSSLNDAP